MSYQGHYRKKLDQPKVLGIFNFILNIQISSMIKSDLSLSYIVIKINRANFKQTVQNRYIKNLLRHKFKYVFDE